MRICRKKFQVCRIICRIRDDRIRSRILYLIYSPVGIISSLPQKNNSFDDIVFFLFFSFAYKFITNFLHFDVFDVITLDAFLYQKLGFIQKKKFYRKILSAIFFQLNLIIEKFYFQLNIFLLKIRASFKGKAYKAFKEKRTLN